MAKKKKEEILEQPKKKEGIPLHVYFSIRQIKEHRQAGMRMYKKANELGMLSLQEWDEFFKSY